MVLLNIKNKENGKLRALRIAKRRFSHDTAYMLYFHLFRITNIFTRKAPKKRDISVNLIKRIYKLHFDEKSKI